MMGYVEISARIVLLGGNTKTMVGQGRLTASAGVEVLESMSVEAMSGRWSKICWYNPAEP